MKHILISLSFIGIIFCVGFKNTSPDSDMIENMEKPQYEFIIFSARKIPSLVIEYYINFSEDEIKERK